MKKGIGASKKTRERKPIPFSKALKAWEKFAWRGFSVINFCPGCMKSLLTADDTLMLGKAFFKADLEACKDVVRSSELGAAGFAFYVPGNEEIALLLEHRVIVHPFCSECSKHAGEEWLEDRVEQNIVLSRRYLPHPKIKLKEVNGE